MPLFPRDKKSPAGEPKHRSLFGFLFVPDVKSSVTPIGETAQVFVRMLAMLFVMNKLFPKDHPGLRPNSPTRLRLSEVIGTAYRNLSYTKEGVPQVLFFYAVISCMAVAALSLVIVFFSMMIGRAHAQGMQFFTPPGNGCSPMTSSCADLGQQFINYLFQGQPVTALDTANGASPLNSGTTSTIIQCGLYTALGVYSDALLIIGAMILFYHLAWMTVETAHHGQVMGKRGNQVWAPIRLVFAVGLLVPIGGTPPSGCTGGSGSGLNAGQILVIAVAQWGNGLGSQVWQVFLNQIQNNQAQLVQPGTPPVRSIVNDLLMMYACQWAYNWQMDGRIANTDGLTPPQPPPNTQGLAQGNQMATGSYYPQAANVADIFEPNTQGKGYPQAPQQPPYVWQDTTPAASGNPTTKYIFTDAAHQNSPLCGYYIIPGIPQVYDPMAGGTDTDQSYLQQIATAVYGAQQQAFGTLISDGSLYGVAVNEIQYFIDDDENGNYQSPPPSPPAPPAQTDVNLLVEGYQKVLDDDIAAAIGALPADTSLATMLGQDGWVGAGAWFNRISRAQTDLMVAASDGLPKTFAPSLGTMLSTTTADLKGTTQDDNVANEMDNEWKITASELHQFSIYISSKTNSGTTALTGNPNLQEQMEFAAEELGSTPAINCGSTIDCMFFAIDHLAGAAGVWHSVPTGAGMDNLLGVQFVGADPFAEIAQYGNALVQTAYALIDWGIPTLLVGAFAEGYATPPNPNDPNVVAGQNLVKFIGGSASMIGTFLITVGGMFFSLGFLMAYFVPLVPFISFFFGVITWVMSMLECVIMVPMIALAHLNPEGDGLPGDMARGAYFLLFQVFLRPVLMVFGLLCGLLVFYVAVSFLNTMFAIAVAGTGTLNNGHLTVARFIFTILYVMLVVIAANNSFNLISRLPNASMQWLGAGSGLGMQDIENVGGIEQRLGGVQAIVTNQLMSQLGQGAQGLGRTGGGAIRNLVAKPPLPGGTDGGRTG